MDRINPEILFSTAEGADSRRVRRDAAAGRLRKLFAGVYTSNLLSDPAAVVQRNWLAIVGQLLPGGVVSHRSAIEGGPRDSRLIVTRRKTRRDLKLPGLTVHVMPGPGPVVEGDSPDMPLGALFLASEPRRYLENLASAKGWGGKVVDRSTIEDLLDKILTLRGEAYLNRIRDNARNLAQMLKMSAEFDRLDKLIGALLGTHETRRLRSKQALARATGRPYDPERLPVFDALFSALNQTVFAAVLDPAPSGAAMENFGFFESYFSNYIEGTTFTVEEAEDIVFRGRVIENRNEDAHDILGTFRAATQAPWRSSVPKDEQEYLRQLQALNEMVMHSHLDKQPGQWKMRANQAGSTYFVQPALVPGTLREGFQRVSALADPMARALMTMFIITEVHPFTDGNGRTARLAMNAVLTAASNCRILIPTIYREEYLLPLKALTHNRESEAYIRAMTRAQQWSAALRYDVPRTELQQEMTACNAFKEERDRYKLLMPQPVPPQSPSRELTS